MTIMGSASTSFIFSRCTDMRKHVLRPVNEFALPTNVRHDLANAGERAIRGIGVGDPPEAVIADVRVQMPSGMSPVRPTNHCRWRRVGAPSLADRPPNGYRDGSGLGEGRDDSHDAPVHAQACCASSPALEQLKGRSQSHDIERRKP